MQKNLNVQKIFILCITNELLSLYWRGIDKWVGIKTLQNF